MIGHVWDRIARHLAHDCGNLTRKRLLFENVLRVFNGFYEIFEGGIRKAFFLDQVNDLREADWKQGDFPALIGGLIEEFFSGGGEARVAK